MYGRIVSNLRQKDKGSMDGRIGWRQKKMGVQRIVEQNYKKTMKFE